MIYKYFEGLTFKVYSCVWVFAACHAKMVNHMVSDYYLKLAKEEKEIILVRLHLEMLTAGCL